MEEGRERKRKRERDMANIGQKEREVRSGLGWAGQRSSI